MQNFDATRIYKGLTAAVDVDTDGLLTACQRLESIGFDWDYRGENGEPSYSLRYGKRGTVFVEFDFGLYRIPEGGRDPESKAGIVRISRSHERRGTPPVKMTWADVSLYSGVPSDIGKMAKRLYAALEARHGFERISTARFNKHVSIPSLPPRSFAAVPHGGNKVAFLFRGCNTVASADAGTLLVMDLEKLKPADLDVELMNRFFAIELFSKGQPGGAKWETQGKWKGETGWGKWEAENEKGN